MEDNFLRYSMSVIIDRALPDVRDGLKPVHRRILYTMGEQGLRPGGKFAKSARIAGEVMGKYHPHGDSSIYDSMVRLAQDWVMRYPLVQRAKLRLDGRRSSCCQSLYRGSTGTSWQRIVDRSREGDG